MRYNSTVRPFPTIFGLAFVGALSSTARAAPLIFDADVPEAPGDFVFVPFNVPEGTVEIEVRHSDMSADNILDFGLDDPKGFRGWGGGNEEAAIVGVEAASRSYLPGPIAPAEWRVVIGKAKIKVKPAHYHIEVDFRTTATLPKVPRTPYAPPSAPLSTSARWYAGDFHVHSRESGDARPTIDDVATFAASRKLDFIELSDHNTVSQDSLIAAAQAKTRILLIPGVEYTTYAGHGNAIGATAWIDHRIGTSSTILQAVDAIHAQGALFSINHPGLDIGDQCIGCGWKHDLPADKVDAIEIETGALKPVGFLFHPLAINLWEKQLATGAHIAALGGSDDHSAGIETDAKSSPIGSPTTLVFARRDFNLAVAAYNEAVRQFPTAMLARLFGFRAAGTF